MKSSENQSPQLKEALALWANIVGPGFIAMAESLDDFPKAIKEPRTYLCDAEEKQIKASETVELGDPQQHYDALEIIVREHLQLGKQEKLTKKVTAKFMRQFGGSPELASLEKLVNDALQVSAQECFQSLRKIDHPAIGKNLLFADSKFHFAGESTGEARAEYATQVFKLVSEKLYQPYLKILLQLCRLAKRAEIQAKKIKLPDMDKQDYGNVLKELLSLSFDSNYPHLIVSEAVMGRNSEAHVDWDYFSGTDEIEFRDRNKPPIRLAVTEVIMRAMQMRKLAGHLLPAYTIAFILKASTAIFAKNPTLLRDHVEQMLSQLRNSLFQTENPEA